MDVLPPEIRDLLDHLAELIAADHQKMRTPESGVRVARHPPYEMRAET